MNLKHLHVFWTVSRLGGVSRAAEQLSLTPQTVSGHIRHLEEDLGAVLFRPVGRGLELTEAGRLALSYANEILHLGGEMKRALSESLQSPMPVLRLGITDVVPKSFAYRLLAPVGKLPDPVRLVCREGSLEMLLAELALQRIDMLVADRPMPSGLAIRGHSHKLGESALAFFGAESLCDDLREFPDCLNDAPLLLPGSHAAIRGYIDCWLNDQRLTPRLMGEFDDGALMKAFGQAGAGFFPAPAILADEICVRYQVRRIGQVEDLHEVFWAITAERRISHPAIMTVMDSARVALFPGATQPTD
ncbi:transcriptional activator NhaR [Azoarcus communis]|uniref:LysR family transcriptional regulator n=1 Tax=Thauera chlorobenzoica TaxID=96773 RepID=A0A1H5WER8_9RHOO|nr:MULTISPECIES: transcriptional activator NhaR [Zoogloeaceae]APR03165.1 LysR family transcriptional regulator [Thauera chlorobenzoica]NMG48790.1 transcriptional activator NhaR [Parazoarcus communis]SEF97964.1 LysR family transcriptional regulator, transcriptional activator of nhaA [Thauera chlorobenzoica]